ncbi:MAG: glycosyltransferase family 1 protein [Verrucomicrobia bacterium]|nr:glycosyltransferase family 1 protein [Verrucomicrobiota bacterium]
MKIVQITPGAGGMFCGGCFRDNAMVKALKRQGHDVTMVPLYLPLTLEEEDQSLQNPVFYGGINVFLKQTLWIFRKLPTWLTRWLDHRQVLGRLAPLAARTRPEDTGPLTLSMLRGEEGKQVSELEALIRWLKPQGSPDVICLSNALLIGLARELKSALGGKMVCTLQGEDVFLDALGDSASPKAWQAIRDAAPVIDAWVAPSHYYAQRMQKRLGLDASKVHVVHNGIPLDGYQRSSLNQNPPVLGYFARMCSEKGLPLLIEAFMLLRQSMGHDDLQLMVGGGLGPSDVPLVEFLKKKLAGAGLSESVHWYPNLSRQEKLSFYSKLTIFSTPALYGESFGLYLLEAMASGVPVVQPPHAAFPEILDLTGGGVIAESCEAKSLASGINQLLLKRDQLTQISERGWHHVHERFSIEHMCQNLLHCFESV